jgi:outer membrane protein assembly factor BamB
VLWQVALETAATPATGDGLVFVAADRLVIALDQRTGRTEWRVPLDEEIAPPLHWEGGWLFVSTASGILVALQSQDGAAAWRTPLGSPLSAAPSAAGERVYAATRQGRVTALLLAGGAIDWSLELKQDVTGLLGLDDQLLVGTRADQLHSVSPQGRIRWSQRAGADVAGRPAADEDRIYFAAFDNLLRALDRRSGNLEWLRGFSSRPAGGPLRVDNVVLVPLITTDIGAFDAATGKPAFTIRAVGELGGTPFLRESATATQPRLVAMSREGTLQGFAARYEPPATPLASLPGTPVKDGW